MSKPVDRFGEILAAGQVVCAQHEEVYFSAHVMEVVPPSKLSLLDEKAKPKPGYIRVAIEVQYPYFDDAPRIQGLVIAKAQVPCGFVLPLSNEEKARTQ